MARRMSDAMFDGVCVNCTVAARRGIEIARGDERDNEEPRGVREAIFDD